MPELPEVEVTRLSFADRIAGARIESAAIGKPLRWPLGLAPAALQGRQVLQVRRRGKYLLLDLDYGLLLLHLGMSGSLAFADQLPAAGPHDHFELVTSQGRLRLHDPRRFGAVVWAESEADPVARKLLGHLGVEPLGPGFEPLAFWQALQARRSAIKQVLLAGDIVVGVGNIYASEALFAAGIAPTLSASGLSQVRAERLHGAIRSAGARARAGRQHAEGLFERRGQVRLFPARSHGLRPRGPALPGLWRYHPDPAPGAAFNLLLPGLPDFLTASPSSCRSPLPTPR